MDTQKLTKQILIRINIIIIIFVFMLCTVLSISKSFETYYGKDENGKFEIKFKTTELSLRQLNKKDYVDVYKISKLQNSLLNSIISVSNEFNSFLTNKGRILPVRVVATDGNYTAFENFDVFKGSFFTKDASENGRNSIVISEKTAESMFSSYDVIGCEINLLDEIYKIVGVYREKNSIISTFISDGFDRAYIPALSLKHPENLNINTIYIKDEGVTNGKYSITKIQEELNRTMSIEKQSYYINDYSLSLSILRQPMSVFIFIVGIWVIMLIFLILIKYLKKKLNSFKNTLNNYYFVNAIKNTKIRLITISLVSVMGILSILSVYKVISFDIYIPVEYVPNDNIFDIGFYRDILVESLNKANSSYMYIPTPRHSIYVFSIKATIIITLIISFLLIFTLTYNIMYIYAGGQLHNMLKSTALSIIFALFLYYLFAVYYGIDIVIPIKELSLTILLIILNSVKKLNLI